MEIKLRAWDKEEQVMVYSDYRNVKDYVLDYEFVTGIKGQITCRGCWDFEDSFGYAAIAYKTLDNIMQYTGLHDKNGTEIYDGDIVTNTGKWFLYARQFYGNQVGIGYGEGEKMVVVKGKAGIELRCIEDFIRQKDGNFAPNGYFHKPYVDNYTIWNLQSTLKVIGNIYEDPEVLEGVDVDVD